MEFVTRRPWRLSNDCVGSLSSCFSPFFDLIFDLKFLNGLEASEVERVSKVSSDISFTGNRKQVNLIVA